MSVDKHRTLPRLVELFAGAGGASLGLHRAGFRHVMLIERDHDSCSALITGGFEPTQMDVAKLFVTPPAELWWASPPCQPFSQAGTRKGSADERNGYPILWGALDRTPNKPKWLIVENVRGLVMHRKRYCGDPKRCPGCYFEEDILVKARRRFKWVDWQVLDAADFGIPQHRKRVVLICGPEPVAWPKPTHGKQGRRAHVSIREALNLGDDLAVVGGGHNPTKAGDVRRYNDLTDRPSTTIPAKASGNAGPFIVHECDAPAWTYRASDADGPSRNIGPMANTSVLWKPAPTDRALRRRLTIEECSILQGFPEGYRFHGTKTSQYRQVGNAVPPELARVVAGAVLRRMRW